MLAYNSIVSNIITSKYILVENNKIEMWFSNWILDMLYKFRLQSNLYVQETKWNAETDEYSIKIYERW